MVRENMRKTFENIWIQPAAGDAGGSLGAALALWHLEYGNKREVNLDDDMKKAIEAQKAGDMPKKSDNTSKPPILKKTKSKSDDLFTVTETAKSSKPTSNKGANSIDNDLLNLTADIQKINLKDA